MAAGRAGKAASPAKATSAKKVARATDKSDRLYGPMLEAFYAYEESLDDDDQIILIALQTVYAAFSMLDAAVVRNRAQHMKVAAIREELKDVWGLAADDLRGMDREALTELLIASWHNAEDAEDVAVV